MPYIVTQNVDYISFTTKTPHIFFADKQYQSINSPNRRYDSCIMLESGGLYLWHSEQERMGYHYIYSAKPLAYLRQTGLDEREIVQTCLAMSSITRIDLAITSQPEDETKRHGFTPHALAWACRDQLLKSRLKPSKDVTENMKTETKYIGNRTSRARLFRAYDKGIESGHVPNFLIRYEMETRRGTKTIARAVIKNEPYGAIIRRYVDFPTQSAWLEIMNALPTKMQHAEPTLSARELSEQKSLSRWQWLINSIPRTVEKALLEDFKRDGTIPQDNEQFHTFIRTIMSKLEVR